MFIALWDNNILILIFNIDSIDKRLTYNCFVSRDYVVISYVVHDIIVVMATLYTSLFDDNTMLSCLIVNNIISLHWELFRNLHW